MCFLTFISSFPEKALQVMLGQLQLQLPGRGGLMGDAPDYKGWRGAENKLSLEKLPPSEQESRETVSKKDNSPIKYSFSFQEQISHPAYHHQAP